MALLQISEPGSKPAKPLHRLAVGSELGTTNSLVAASSAGAVETLADDEGSHLLPSVVHYPAGLEPVVGQGALDKLTIDPANTIISTKRMLGKNLLDIQADDDANKAATSLYQFDQNSRDGVPQILTAAGLKSPVQISADILGTLASRAESVLGGKLEGVVITVPAYFNDAQRQQTKEAAKLAGLNVLRLLNEPTAAAVAYGLDTNDQGRIIIFDLGGGTFDVSLLSLQRGVFEVLSTGGDTNLGGDDFDRVIMDWICSEAGLDQITDSKSFARLRNAAIAAKHSLTEADIVEINFEHWQGALSRAQFIELSADLVKRIINTCRRVIRDASISVDEIDNIVLVGGATRMLVIREAVAEFFGKPALAEIDPDKVVAIGAGIQADVLIGNKPANDFLLLDVNPLSLGIETMGELVEKIIPRNTTIPVARDQEFTTFKEGQTVMSLHVVQGERELVSDCRSLARFELRGIPPMVAGAAKIRVKFQVDADGLLSVSAEELSTGMIAEIQVKPSFGLNADAIEEMLQSSQENALADMEARSIGEARLEAQQLIDALASAVEIDGDLLDESESLPIKAAIEKLERANTEGDSSEIRVLTEDLNRVSGNFAARRMDLHIGAALRGESIDMIESSSD